jgi:hypothetical protein
VSARGRQNARFAMLAGHRRGDPYGMRGISMEARAGSRMITRIIPTRERPPSFRRVDPKRRSQSDRADAVHSCSSGIGQTHVLPISPHRVDPSRTGSRIARARLGTGSVPVNSGPPLRIRVTVPLVAECSCGDMQAVSTNAGESAVAWCGFCDSPSDDRCSRDDRHYPWQCAREGISRWLHMVRAETVRSTTWDRS